MQIPPFNHVLMSPGYVKAVAQMAYVWGWPMVNMHNRRAAITQAPEPGPFTDPTLVNEVAGITSQDSLLIDATANSPHVP